MTLAALAGILDGDAGIGLGDGGLHFDFSFR